MNRSFNLAIIGGIGLMVAALVLVGFNSREQLEKLAESRIQITHTHQVIGTLYALRSSIDEAETRQRGYVITGDPSYLDNYDDACARVQELLDQLHAMTADNDRQVERLDNIKPLIDLRLSLLQKTIDIRQKNGFEQAKQYVITNSGNVQMDKIRSSISEMMDTENELVKIRTQATERRARAASNQLLALSGVAVLFQVFLIIVITAFVNSRQKAVVRLRTVFNSMAEGLIQTDKSGNVRYLNPAGEVLLGIDSKKARESKWYELFGMDKGGTTDFDSQQSVKEAQAKVRGQDGTSIYIQYSSAPIDNESFEGAVISFQDVTDTRLAEQRAFIHHQITNILAEGESLGDCIEAILKTCCEMLQWDYASFWMVNEESQVLRNFRIWHKPDTGFERFAAASGTMEFASGIGLPGRVWQSNEPIWIEDVQKETNFLARDAEQEDQLHSALMVPISLGQITFGVIEMFSREIRGMDQDLLATFGSVAGLIALFVERNRARHDLMEREARTSAMFDTAADGIFTIAGEGIIETANRAAHKMFGYRTPELLGMNIATVLPGFGGAEQDNSNLNTGEHRIGSGMELSGRLKNGDVIPVELTMSIVNLGDRNIVTGIVRDISQRKEVERRVSELYSTVSHELRTPLTSIRGSLGLLEGGRAGELTGRAKQLIEIARSESDRLIRLINDILDIKKIQAGKLELSLETLNPEELIVETIGALSGLAHGKEITLVKDVRWNGNVHCDRDRIRQVLTNLVSNAIKFSPDKTKVLITLEHGPQNRCKFSVSDSGPGIAADQMHKLFGLFQQLDASDARSKEGTGLGLAISKAIVEEHRGTIGVNSVPGSGSTFWFELPLPDTEQASQMVTGERNERTVAMVEDDFKG